MILYLMYIEGWDLQIVKISLNPSPLGIKPMQLHAHDS